MVAWCRYDQSQTMTSTSWYWSSQNVRRSKIQGNRILTITTTPLNNYVSWLEEMWHSMCAGTDLDFFILGSVCVMSGFDCCNRFQFYTVAMRIFSYQWDDSTLVRYHGVFNVRGYHSKWELLIFSPSGHGQKLGWLSGFDIWALCPAILVMLGTSGSLWSWWAALFSWRVVWVKVMSGNEIRVNCTSLVDMYIL